jgi:prophage tail gpP-like protein
VKGAIATVDFFASNSEEATVRLSLVIDSPQRCSSGEGWQCRVALADLYRPETVVGRDSIEALSLALAQARVWISELRTQGRTLTRDRAGEHPFELR